MVDDRCIICASAEKLFTLDTKSKRYKICTKCLNDGYMQKAYEIALQQESKNENLHSRGDNRRP